MLETLTGLYLFSSVACAMAFVVSFVWWVIKPKSQDAIFFGKLSGATLVISLCCLLFCALLA